MNSVGPKSYQSEKRLLFGKRIFCIMRYLYLTGLNLRLSRHMSGHITVNIQACIQQLS